MSNNFLHIICICVTLFAGCKTSREDKTTLSLLGQLSFETNVSNNSRMAISDSGFLVKQKFYNHDINRVADSKIFFLLNSVRQIDLKDFDEAVNKFGLREVMIDSFFQRHLKMITSDTTEFKLRFPSGTHECRISRRSQQIIVKLNEEKTSYVLKNNKGTPAFFPIDINNDGSDELFYVQFAPGYWGREYNIEIYSIN